MFRFIRSLILELRTLAFYAIVGWPNSPIGNRLRRIYWRKKLGNSNIRTVGRGAEIVGVDGLHLGEGFILGDHAILNTNDSEPVYIGNFVAIARGAYLRSANHRTDDIDIPIQQQGHTSAKIEYKGCVYSIVIEDDVWIGANAIVLSGTFLERGCVVSAGSVVSSHFPPYSVVVGNPARVVLDRLKLAHLDDKNSGERQRGQI